MAQIKVRMLVDTADADGTYPCNSVQTLEEDKARQFVAAGYADSGKAAVAYAEAEAKKAAKSDQ